MFKIIKYLLDPLEDDSGGNGDGGESNTKVLDERQLTPPIVKADNLALGDDRSGKDAEGYDKEEPTNFDEAISRLTDDVKVVEGGKKKAGEVTTEEEHEELDPASGRVVKEKRDYTGFDKEDVEILKKLPNIAFKHTVPALKKFYAERERAKGYEQELITLKKDPSRLPETWYTHEQAYTLSPSYQKVAVNLSRAEYEMNFWEQQLIKVKSAQPWNNLTYANGQYGQGDDIDPSPEAEFKLQRAYNQAAQFVNKFQREIEGLQKQFTDEYKQVDTWYDKSQELFNQLLPELKPLAEGEKLFLDITHPAHRNLSVTKVAAKMFSVIINQGKLIKKLQEGKVINDSKKSDDVLAGPKNRTRMSGGSGKINPKAEIDFSKIEDEMNS